jgi:hypothetical protein
LLQAPYSLAASTRSPEQARASGAKWAAWHAQLEEAGQLAGGAQLEAERIRVTAAGTDASAPPPAELQVGGYFLVEAPTLQAAAEIARGCPLVAAGGTVEVRPLMA